MADRATTLSIWALIVALAVFVSWNLKPGAVSLISVGPNRCEIEGRGPGWPFPAYTRHAQLPAPDVQVGELFRTPADEAAALQQQALNNPQLREAAEAEAEFAKIGQWNRWLPNGLVGGLLVVALVANIARGCRDARQAGDTDRYHRWVGYVVLVVLSAVGLAVLAGVGAAIRWWRFG